METSNQEQADAGIEVVNARLTYLAEATPKPVNYTYDPPAGVPRQSGKYAERSVAVRNGRGVLSELSLDTNGFVLTEHVTAVKDFYDSDEVKSVYYPEVERLLKRVTGAERVLIFDHIVRNPLLAERGEKGRPRAVQDRAQRLQLQIRAASRPRSSAGGSRPSAQESLGRNQRLARDSPPDRKVAAGALRRPQPERRGHSAGRSGLSRPCGRNLRLPLQPESSLVLLSAIGTPRSDLTQVLRFPSRWSRAFQRAHLVR